MVVGTYAGAAHLPECLRSLKTQTHAPSEIIVVDASSEDGTAELAVELARPHEAGAACGGDLPVVRVLAQGQFHQRQILPASVLGLVLDLRHDDVGAADGDFAPVIDQGLVHRPVEPIA